MIRGTYIGKPWDSHKYLFALLTIFDSGKKWTRHLNPNHKWANLTIVGLVSNSENRMDFVLKRGRLVYLAQ